MMVASMCEAILLPWHYYHCWHYPVIYAWLYLAVIDVIRRMPILLVIEVPYEHLANPRTGQFLAWCHDQQYHKSIFDT